MRERIPSDVAICVGERHYTRFGIRSLLEKHVCDIIMPDITRCGGPSEMKRMATMAEAYQVLLAPHNPNGPLSTLASSHVCASVPNFFRQEFMFNDVPWRDTVIDHPIADMVYDGHLHLSDRPGLGVDLVEEEMEKHPGITSNPPENFLYLMRMPFQIDLIGKVVLITGVSSGIGLGTAHEFARAGACVAGCARKPESDDSVSAFLQAVEGEGCKALYVQADVTQEEELEKLVQEVIATFGRLDIVVSNAGMNVFEGAAECSESRWAYNLDLNLASHWRLARIAKPYLEQSGNGVILLMTSNHAFCSIPGCFPYNVTKTAITGLVRSLTIEWGPKIRTVGVAPGFIDTAGNDTWFNSFPDAMAERNVRLIFIR